MIGCTNKMIIRSLALMLVACSATAFGENLYSESTFHALAEDHRALHVGDALTVLVLEQAKAEARANTDTADDVSIAAKASDNIADKKVGIDVSADDKGGGRSRREGNLKAQITVNVESVTPSGDLWVAGEQSIIVNNEEQRIRIEGRVRRYDIMANNTVISSRISDARIQYTGQGDLNDAQRQGVITKVMRFLRLI